MSVGRRVVWIWALVLWAAGCGDDAHPVGTDAALDGAVDAAPDASADAGPCVSFAGAYDIDGTCNNGPPFSIGCVSQTGCHVTLTFPVGVVFQGDAVGARALLTGSSGTLTLQRTASGYTFDSQQGTLICEGTGALIDTPQGGACCAWTAPGTADSCDSTGQCTIFEPHPAVPILITACQPRGSVPEGQPCSRDDTTLGSNCTQGTYCSGLGDPNPGERRCRRLCSSNSECGADVCAFLSTAPLLATPIAGVCAPRCAAVTAGACPAGATCRPILALPPTGLNTPMCTPDGTVPRGGACQSVYADECAAGLICISGASETCQPLCRIGATDCAAGETCTNAPPLGAAFGFCQATP